MPVFRPGKPYALRTLTADQTAGTSPYTISWNATESDGAFGLTATGLEVLVAGLYLVTLCVANTGTGTAARAQARIVVNGTVKASDMTDTSTGAVSAGASLVDQLEVGDVVTASIPFALAGGKQIESDLTRLAVVRIGPVRWT